MKDEKLPEKLELANAEIKRLQKLLGVPFPPRDVIKKLVEAAEHLLHDHNCDAHGYEETMQAVAVAKKWLNKRSNVL